MPPLTLLKTIPLTSEKGLDPQSFLLDNQPRTVTHPPYKGPTP